MFHYSYKVRMEDTDVAGVIFFARYFNIMSAAYEEMLQSLGFSIDDLMLRGFYVPLVHAEADYLAPITLGEKLTIEIGIEKLGSSSYSCAYKFINAQGTLAAKGRSVHVSVNSESRQSIELPSKLKQGLETLL